MIDPATVEKIKNTADIVEVVSDYVHLVRRGANYMGLCPFHNERTPSFSVNRSRNFCYCFSCHKGGSPVNFIMEKEGVSYHEALLQLARKYGIEVRERELSDEERQQQTLREGMLVANEWAKNYFIENLNEKEEGINVGLSYLYGRKVTPEAIRAFQIGYAIDKNSDYTDEAIKKGFSTDILKATGLTGSGSTGGFYDKFRGRVIFPILNTAGKTVAFGGRDLKGSPAKYINSPESEVYSKSRELYGIYQAKGDMVKENKVYLVEGYLDVIGMWQSGIKNVVASSGTALTDGQISLIHRFTDNVTLIYDGDSAGLKASIRGIDMLLSHNLNVKAVALPEGEDPDSLSAKLSPEELRSYLKENEVDIIRFKISVLLSDAPNDPQSKWQAVRSIIQTIACIPDKIKRDIYVQECSSLLDIKESTLISEIKKARFQIIEQQKQRQRVEDIQKQFPDPTLTPVKEKTENNHIVVSTPSNSDSKLYPLEKQLLENCLRYGFMKIVDSDDEQQPENFTTVVEFIAEELSIDGITFSHPEYKKVFQSLYDLIPTFKKDFSRHCATLQETIEKKRKEGYLEIGNKTLSLPEIKREENVLENKLEEYAEKEKRSFAKDYILFQFGSHEDDLLRKYTNEALAEKHKLSNIFTKNSETENKEIKLVSIIVTSLNVLKNGIIDVKLQDLLNELKNLEAGSQDKEKELHARIGEIIQMRSRMAKDIGDRIISPTSLTKKNRNA